MNTDDNDNENDHGGTDPDYTERAGHAMMLAWGRVKKATGKLWGEWMVIGDGLMEGRRWAMERAGTNRPEGKGYALAFSEYLERFKVDDMDKSDRAKLLQLMEERPAVEALRASWSIDEQRRSNNPVIVWRKYTAATRVKKRSRTAGVSATEHGRAQALIQQQQERMNELTEELEAEKEAAVSDIPSAIWFLIQRIAPEMPLGDIHGDGTLGFDLRDMIALVKWLQDAVDRWKAEQRKAEKAAEASGGGAASSPKPQGKRPLVFEPNKANAAGGHDEMQAAITARTRYVLTPMVSRETKKFLGYDVCYQVLDQGKLIKKSRAVGQVATYDEAVELAQRDYDAQG